MKRVKTWVVVGAALMLGACGHGWGPGAGPGGSGPWTMGAGPGSGMTGDAAGGCAMGPGMMGGTGGWGMGPGRMGGGPGMGPGMMGGPGWGLGQLDLSAEQRARIDEIQADIGRRQWALMNAVHAQGGPMHGGAWDEAGERRAYEAMSAVHKQMFELRLEAQKRVMEVLTPAQREQLSRGGAGR